MEDEHRCRFISSMGFCKSADWHALEIHSNEDYFANVQHGAVLYIKTDALAAFAKKVHLIAVKFVLVSGCSDYSTPHDVFATRAEFETLLNNPNLTRWYVQNLLYKHPKMERLPIGLDYHTMRTNGQWGCEKSPLQQEHELLDVARQGVHLKRKVLVYSNCHFFTSTKFGSDRIAALATIPSELMHLEPAPCERVVSWRNQIECAFVLSPHGNGLDCHRTWEALILGCIPIVKTSAIDSLYDNLPVVIVQDWSNVTRDLLMETLHTYANTKFHYEKLTLKYWTDKMRL